MNNSLLQVRAITKFGVIAVTTMLMAITTPVKADLSFANPDEDAGKIHGGPGGGPFAVSCGTGAYMTGINVRSGTWINAISGVCTRFDAVTQRFIGGEMTTNPAGGTDGDTLTARCNAGQAINEIKFGFTRDGDKPKWLDYVQLGCSGLLSPPSVNCIGTGHGCWDRHPDYSGSGKLSFKSKCYADAVTALIGRSGRYVDALGIQCRGLPANPNAPPPRLPK